jgi:DNA invertase Pin-like site-specific DNA recombinase
MRSVLYLRMSTDRQEASIAQQRDALVAFAAKQGHEIVGEYVDEGISGDATHKRHGFRAMIGDAAGGRFDRILCWDQSRFGRFDSIEAGTWVAPLRDAGVSLETIDGGVVDWGDFAGRITYAVAQEGKHQFLRDLSRNVVRGLTAKATAGNGWCGGPTPFGFKSETAVIGRSHVSTFRIDERTAAIVRRIFMEYAQPAASIRSIVAGLNRDGAPTPSGRGSWVRGSVYRILTSPLYRGDYVWGRTMSGRYHGRAGGEIITRRPGQGPIRNDPIVHENAIPAIVDRDLFDRVQLLIRDRKKATRRATAVRPLSGLITCERCGRPMHADGGAYKCSSTSEGDRGERCTGGRVNAEKLLDAVASGLRSRLLSPARLRAVKARLERIVEAQREEGTGTDASAIDRQIADLERQVAEGVARIPLLPKSLVPDMAKGLDRLRAQRDALVRQRDALEDAKAGRGSSTAERVASAIAAAYGLRDALRSADPALVNHHLRLLGVAVKTAARGPRAGSATVVVDPLTGPAGDLFRTPYGSEQVSASPLLTFTVAVPAGRPGPKPRRKAS